MEYYEHKLDPVGQRPDWLDDDDKCEPCWEDRHWYGGWSDADCVAGWGKVTSIKIPASHWAVPALKAGKVPVRGEDMAERMFKVIEQIAFEQEANYFAVRECKDIVKAMQPADPLIALFEEIHGERCQEGETWPEKMAKLTRYHAAKHNLKIVEA